MFGSKKLVGLDIGTSSIKIAELKLGKRPTLLSFAVSPTPEKCLYAGEIVEPASISGVIRELLARAKSTRHNAATGMWGTAVIVKKISIPKMDEKLITEQIRWEAEQYIPFDINEISLDYHVLKSHSAIDTMDVLLVAAKQELVLQYAEVVEGAGVRNGIIDVCGFALANCFERSYGRMSGCVALVNIGAEVTNFVVINNGEVVFCRDIPAGGVNYTFEIHKELGISLQEAEALKINSTRSPTVPEEVQTIMKNTCQTVSEEINNSFEFFMATSGGLSISKCFYTGGGSLTPGLIGAISQSTGVHFEPMDPFLGLKTNPRTFSPGYVNQIRSFCSVAVGLALREVGDS